MPQGFPTLSLVCPLNSSLLVGQELLPMEASCWHPYQMLELTPFQVKEQQIYSKFLTDD